MKPTLPRLSAKKYTILLVPVLLLATSVFARTFATQKPDGNPGEAVGFPGDFVAKTPASPTPSAAPVPKSCITSPGPAIRLTEDSTSYTNKELEASTKIDASEVIFTNGGKVLVNLGGGADICWYSGKLHGGYPPDESWDLTHLTMGIQIQDGTLRPTIEGVYIDQIGDGIKVRLGEDSGQAGIAEPFTVRSVWMRDIRDDCIESDWQAGALIEDSLLEGCYSVFATKKRSDVSIDGSHNTWEIRDTLVYMHDQMSTFRGDGPGHSMFFKWDETSPKWKMYNSILRVDSDAGPATQFDFRLDKLVDCKDNILVWLGPGSFPGTLPDCFTVTKDKSVWDGAVSDWKFRHGYAP